MTLTVGGNDLLGAYADTPHTRRVIEVVRQRVGETLDRLRPLMRAPNDPIILGTVYGELNGELRSVAAEHGVRVADIPRAVPRPRAPGGDPAKTDPRPGDRELSYCRVIEPNAWGADGVRAAFWEALHS